VFESPSEMVLALVGLDTDDVTGVVSTGGD